MIKREKFLNKIRRILEVVPVCAVLGPRQCGKTTLAKEYLVGSAEFFDLENDHDLTRLSDPLLTLGDLEGVVAIDEIQRRPDLFSSLRHLVDNKRQRYLILGSASQELIRQSSESLAGRIGYVELTPFQITEINGELDSLLIKGGFPRSYLAADNEASVMWRQFYIKTFLEKDIPSFGFEVSPQQIRRFWTMLAHYHGNNFNASEIGGSLGINYKTAQRYFDILDSTFMVRRLSPWFESIKKRQVKTSKVYFKDSGILLALLNINNKTELLNHPKLGGIWEGFALEETIRINEAEPQDCYFWSIHNGAELDLLIIKNGQRVGFEFKYSSKPTVTKSMQTAIQELKLDHLWVIIPSGSRFKMSDTITCCSLREYVLQQVV